MDLPLIISFYCDPPGETYFSRHGARLRHQLQDIPHEIVPKISDKTWLENTRKKPGFILRMLQMHRQPVLWLDVDTDVVQPPVYAWEKDLDFAAPRFTGVSKLEPPLLIRSTALWFNHTPAAIDLLEDWKHRCEVGRHGDHRELSNLLYDYRIIEGTLKKANPILKWGFMPDSYAHPQRMQHSVLVMGLSREVKSRQEEQRRIDHEIAQASKAPR